MENNIEWLAPEYDHNPQNNDWFWALGIVVIVGVVLSFIYSNYFFGILILLGGILLGYFNIKKPEIVDHELTNEGLRIKDRLYKYENLKHFWVQRSPRAQLFVHSDRKFMPVIVMPIYDGIADKIREKLLSMNIEEREMQDHFSVKVMEFLGF